jgi:hypothetical protein
MVGCMNKKGMEMGIFIYLEIEAVLAVDVLQEVVHGRALRVGVLPGQPVLVNSAVLNTIHCNIDGRGIDIITTTRTPWLPANY